MLYRTALCVLITAFMIGAAPFGLMGQARFEVQPTVEIPRSYQSWSLFLICNPSWLVRNGEAGIEELFQQYRFFGETIGPDNLAIWFWKEAAAVPTAALTDIERGSTYCVKFGLLPSQSPHVLVTTVYPDDAAIGDYFVVRLGDLDANSSAQALTDLADQLVVSGLDQPALESGTRWLRIVSAFKEAASGAGCYFNKVSIAVKAGAMNLEVAHSVAQPNC